MEERLTPYTKIVDKRIPDRDAKILVVAGGKNDSLVFKSLGFENVTISNLDDRMTGDEFLPYRWSFQDAENLSFENEEFDFVVIHAALHHCYSPHRALLEMYRVAKRGILFFEARDSFVMNLVLKLGLTQSYEHAAVYYNDCKYGGVQNTDIPNFVYRWTEREIEKTINCYSPFAKHHFSYSYYHDKPRVLELRKKSIFKNLLVTLLVPGYYIFTRIFPKQQNLFACYVEKPNMDREHFEWLTKVDGKFIFNKSWGDNYYKSKI